MEEGIAHRKRSGKKGMGKLCPPVLMLLLFKAPQPILLCWQLWEGLPRALGHAQQGPCALLSFLHVQRDPPEPSPAPLPTPEPQDPRAPKEAGWGHQGWKNGLTSAGSTGSFADCFVRGPG